MQVHKYTITLEVLSVYDEDVFNTLSLSDIDYEVDEGHCLLSKLEITKVQELNREETVAEELACSCDGTFFYYDEEEDDA